MPRPERPLDDDGGPVAQLATALRHLRERAGKPGYRQMAARANYSVATLSAAASGRKLPTLEVTLAYAAACDGDPVEWERLWREAERLSVRAAQDESTAYGHERSPYPGLAMFQPADAELFFGRAALVDELVSRLGRSRFLVIFGSSGAGKSSVVRAGLVPAFAGPAMVLTPGEHPLAELAVHLARYAGVSAGGLLSELRADPVRAQLLVRQGAPEADLLVVVDQFEETFAACADPAERADFVTALLAMCREPDGRARVVLAVRADHYARFTEHPQLLAAMSDAHMLIGGMNPAELREAVTGPAERHGARVEGALVATVVAEVNGSPGALPLAAHALREAWHRRQGAMVTLAGYQAAGGMAGAVAHTAERAYARLSAAERQVARQVLVRMVDVGPDEVITRRRLSQAELGAIERAPEVIEVFAAARLVSMDRDCVELVHEALIQAWPRLRGWVEEGRAGLRLHRRLTEAAVAWESHDRDEGALYRGSLLSTVAEAADTKVIEPAGTEREFLEASRTSAAREERRRERRTRWLFTRITVAMTVVVTLAVGAIVSARRATAERDRATAWELAAAARTERENDPELALLLASRAYGLHPDDQTESVLRQATADAQETATIDVSVALAGAPSAPSSSAVSADGRSFAIADLSGDQIHWWRTATDEKPAVVECRARDVTLSSDGSLLAADCGENEIRVWRMGDRRPAARFGGAGPVAINRDGTLIAMSDRAGGVLLWDPVNERAVRTLTGRATQLRFSPDGRELAVADDDGAIRIWPPAGHDDPVGKATAMNFSPDGKLIAGIGTDDVLRVWNTDGSGEALTFDHPGGASQLAFSADGRRLITLHGANVRSTPCEVCGPIDDVLALSKQLTTRDLTPEERARYLHEDGGGRPGRG
ncbi:nSTAND1 domain-containing NTPase [Paractinoplanes lichenicola]|uniref:HTH cro/C1-type domain-containing protein n=1 Tax=Paractinoplanes lichenicola TaxID=2802976 RepID=A0ABS1VHD5_9ACTN|nr:hypothetical protein [Actinoplanes lichenicola]MBL7253896.1 hypothetical protein [Actinoplanes lichenicola]